MVIEKVLVSVNAVQPVMVSNLVDVVIVHCIFFMVNFMVLFKHSFMTRIIIV